MKIKILPILLIILVCVYPASAFSFADALDTVLKPLNNLFFNKFTGESIKDISGMAVSLGDNFALTSAGATCTASYTYTYNVGINSYSRPCTSALDNNINSYWTIIGENGALSTGKGTNVLQNAWIKIALPQPKLINKLILSGRTDKGSGWVSKAKLTLYDAAENVIETKENIVVPYYPSQPEGVITIEPKTIKSARLDILETFGPNAAITEFRIYYETGYEEPTQPAPTWPADTNLIPISSCTAKDANNKEILNCVITRDYNDNTFFETSSAKVTVRYNFDKTYDANKICIKVGNNFNSPSIGFNGDARFELLSSYLAPGIHCFDIKKANVNWMELLWYPLNKQSQFYEMKLYGQVPAAQPQAGASPYCEFEGKKIPAGGRIKKMISSAQTVAAPGIGGVTGAAITATKAGATYEYWYCYYDTTTNNLVMKKSKQKGELCDNNYECYTNYCMYGTVCGTVVSEITPAGCAGCLINNKCLPVGARLGGKYCPEPKAALADQKPDNTTPCENNYECKSNACNDNTCISVKDIRESKPKLQQILDILCAALPEECD